MWQQISEEENKILKITRLLKKASEFSENIIYVNQQTECGNGPLLLDLLRECGIPCKPIGYRYPIGSDYKSKKEFVVYM